MNTSKKIAIIGGGAAGFFSAITAAQLAQQSNTKVEVYIFESSDKYLKKVKISGGGRCNVTHNIFEVQNFVKNYPRGQRELLSPMQRFQAKDTVEWFKAAGIEIVAEEDGRMFPVTNSSETIIQCYLDMVEKLGIHLMPNHSVEDMRASSSISDDRTANGLAEKSEVAIERLNNCKETDQIELKIKNQEPFFADAVLVATGSSPGGYKLAESMGHTITERAPSLFSFKIDDPLIKELPGLSFKTSLILTLPDKKTFKQIGPSLITHWGMSGPGILKLSAWAAREMKRAKYDAVLTVNWMGTMKIAEIDQLLQGIKTSESKSLIRNAYPTVLPKRFWLSLLEKLNIDFEKQWANISKKELAQITENLGACKLKILGQNRFKDEFVECGGVKLSEIDFKTMQSKIHPRLHFAGEILDIDGITGGFNFQNAWTTGWLAAHDMVEQAK